MKKMTSNKKNYDPKKEVAEIIRNPENGKQYFRGKFLGKGGFARCYELTDAITKTVYAGKIVSKALLMKQHQKEKMTQEIEIHRSLRHKNIVEFHSFFEDPENVYIILEVCRRKSLMELHKRRRAITEPEARYFFSHILQGVKHLHDRHVIHRDLKLGNLFISETMEVKIGDFGLATRVGYEGERKKTLCGTPNYIAPEILSKQGHSYEVDIWSLGCILYTLLVGKPPFETQTLKDTYMRIKKNEYSIPSTVRQRARTLIQKLLQDNPSRRPPVSVILNDEFMTMGYLPSRLPTSCLTMAPRFDAPLNASIMTRKPLLEINKEGGKAPAHRDKPPGTAILPQGRGGHADIDELEAAAKNKPMEPEDCYIQDLFNQVDALVKSNPTKKEIINEDEAEDPAAVPMIWVSKWVDYSDKYGLGYHLSDDSIGVLFNDYTKLLLLQDGENIHYIERNANEHYHKLSDFPKELEKKITLLRYFRNYMNEHLIKAGAAMAAREGDELARIPVLRTYFRTRSAIVLHLSNGTLQINFFDDHTKLILCPLLGAITFIDTDKRFRTFKMEKLLEYGCSEVLFERVSYARNMIEKLMRMKVNSKTAGSARSVASAFSANAK